MLKPDKTVIDQFNYTGNYLSFEVNTEGLINNTYILKYQTEDNRIIHYALQRVNTNVFREPEHLMSNIVRVTEHLRKKILAAGGDPNRETLNFIPTKSGAYGYLDKDGDFWRTYLYVDHVIAHNFIQRPVQFKNAGKAFGRFQNLLSDFPSDELYETIPRFHDTVKRYNDLMAAIERNTAGRAEDVADEIAFAKAHRPLCGIILDGMSAGKIPLRVTHNDTKLNNVLMDENTDEAVCVIDLDTIMPGSALYDFGDSIRFGANAAAEDEKDLSKVYFVESLFENYTEGFLSEVAAALTETELENLAMSAILMTLECGMRFLTDYLDGDVYFHTRREGHNLDRTRTQFKLVADMEARLPEMNRIVREIAAKYR